MAWKRFSLHAVRHWRPDVGSVHATLRHAKSIGYPRSLALAKLQYFGARSRFDLETSRLTEITPNHTIVCNYRKTDKPQRAKQPT